MQKHFTLMAAGLCLSMTAAHAFELGHTRTGGKAKPAQQMAWSYRTLAAGLELFERRAPEMAPGAALAYVLPPGQDAGPVQVQLVSSERSDAVPLIRAASFTLPREAAADAKIVANRMFREGEWRTPGVEVRSAGLDASTRRLGDLRLACDVQVTVGKAETTGLRMLLAAGRVFGLNVCDEMPVTHIDAPSGGYDRIVVEDGQRRVVQAAHGADKAVPRLGDAAWSNDTRIRYVLAGEPAQ